MVNDITDIMSNGCAELPLLAEKIMDLPLL